MTRDVVMQTLRHLSAEYIRSRRAGGELRARLVASANDRDVRGTLERSVRSTDERVRAIEAVIAAVVTAMPEVPQPGLPAPATLIRGTWTEPGQDV